MKKPAISLFFFCIVIFRPALTAAQVGPAYESGGVLIYEQAAYDVSHYELDLRIDPADSTISGSVIMRAELVHPTDVIVLDIDPRLTVEAVRSVDKSSAEEDLRFSRADSSKRMRVKYPVTRQPGEQIAVEVIYQGRPKTAANPPWDGGFIWETTPSGNPWVSVASQTTGSWIWWPSKDHPSDRPDSVTVHFTLPESLTAVANGEFRGTSAASEGWETWHWHSENPISNYNVTLNAAPYQTIHETYKSVSGDEMDLIFWVLPEDIERGRKLFPQFAEQLRFLEKILGPYPFRSEKYGVAQVPYLGMEHQTIIAYGAGFQNDRLFNSHLGFDDLHHHELAHEWWGNLVTVYDWRDFWIHEGFATYMQALYAEHLGGAEPYDRLMNVFARRISGRKALVPERDRTTVEMYETELGGDIYFKGAWFLHTLRYVVGDDLFFQSLRRFIYPSNELEQLTEGSQARFVTTRDYLQLVSSLAKTDLGWLFDVYLYQPGLPVLEVHRTENDLLIRWKTEGNSKFPMPVEIRVEGDIRTISPGKEGHRLQVSPSAEVVIDPHHRILMNVKWADYSSGRGEPHRSK